MYIDVNDVLELRKIKTEKSLITLGANVTLTMAKTFFENYKDTPGFNYLKQMADHLDLVASIPIRNVSLYKFFHTQYTR